MLADDRAVEGAVFGDEGLLAALGKGAVHVSSSTIGIALSRGALPAHMPRPANATSQRLCSGGRKPPPPPSSTLSPPVPAMLCTR